MASSTSTLAAQFKQHRPQEKLQVYVAAPLGMWSVGYVGAWFTALMGQPQLVPRQACHAIGTFLYVLHAPINTVTSPMLDPAWPPWACALHAHPALLHLSLCTPHAPILIPPQAKAFGDMDDTTSPAGSVRKAALGSGAEGAPKSSRTAKAANPYLAPPAPPPVRKNSGIGDGAGKDGTGKAAPASAAMATAAQSVYSKPFVPALNLKASQAGGEPGSLSMRSDRERGAGGGGGAGADMIAAIQRGAITARQPAAGGSLLPIPPPPHVQAQILAAMPPPPHVQAQLAASLPQPPHMQGGAGGQATASSAGVSAAAASRPSTASSSSTGAGAWESGSITPAQVRQHTQGTSPVAGCVWVWYVGWWRHAHACINMLG